MRNQLARGGAVGVIAAVLVLLGSGLAYAGGCHHHPPKTHHVTVSASFTDQVCLGDQLVVGTAAHSDTPGVWWSTTGSTEPGDTVTLTAHAKTKQTGTVIDGTKVFSHTYPATPTAESCLPVRKIRAHYDIKAYNGCTPSKRYVEVTEKRHVQKVTKRHNKNRTKWRLTIRADKGAVFPGGARVDHVAVALRPPKRCHSHPHGS
jgi:hypothetical protein